MNRSAASSWCFRRVRRHGGPGTPWIRRFRFCTVSRSLFTGNDVTEPEAAWRAAGAPPRVLLCFIRADVNFPRNLKCCTRIAQGWPRGQELGAAAGPFCARFAVVEG